MVSGFIDLKGGEVIMMFIGLIIMFFGFVFVVALMALLYFLYQRGDLDFLKGNENPREILERRYAAGEIDDVEYQKIKQSLIE